MPETTENIVEQALIVAMQHYLSACRDRVPHFVQQHLHYPGTWHTNKRAMGWDLLRAPVNLFWAPIYLGVQLLVLILKKVRLSILADYLRNIPSGLMTDIQRYLTDQTFTQLLGRNNQDDNEDELYKYIYGALTQLPDDLEQPNNNLSLLDRAHIDTIIHDALEQYRITRTASADMGNSLFSTIVGGFAFQKFTPGGFAIGLTIAAWLAQQLAVDNFILGDWFGRIYYSLFPATPSLSLSVASVALVMTCLAVLASFSGLITDPIQNLFGLHQRRLIKMLNHLENDLLQRKSGGFRPKDQFVARILELIDLARAQGF